MSAKQSKREPEFLDLVQECFRTKWYQEFLREYRAEGPSSQGLEDSVWAGSIYVGRWLCGRLNRPLSLLEQVEVMDVCRSSLQSGWEC